MTIALKREPPRHGILEGHRSNSDAKKQNAEAGALLNIELPLRSMTAAW